MDKLPEIARQKSSSMDDLYVQARDSNDEFVQTLSAVLNDLKEQNPEKFENSYIKLGGIKHPKKANDNVLDKFDGDVSRTCDILRATYVGPADTFDEFFEALDTRMQIVAMKDRIARPNEFGYRDRKVNAALASNGHICEVQGLVQEIENVRNETHPFRERAKQIEKRAKGENRLMTEAEREEHHFLRMFCMSKHNEAAIKANLNSKLDPSLPEERLEELRTVSVPFLDFDKIPALTDAYKGTEKPKDDIKAKHDYDNSDDKLDI